MPLYILILALTGAAYQWMLRTRDCAVMAQEFASVAQDVFVALWQFNAPERPDLHAVDHVMDAELAVVATAIAFVGLGGAPTAEAHDVVATAVQRHQGRSDAETQDVLGLGHWLHTECDGS